jgi:REP element-mobilizing transposase RayT
MYKTYLYAHVIWSTTGRGALLTRPVRIVLFAHLQKSAEEKGIRILQVNGAADHIHILLQLHPSQNLSQVVRQLKTDSADWLNTTQLLTAGFSWEDDFAAYSVSPSALKQVSDYIERQEEYHKTKTLDAELEVFEKVQSSAG